MTNDAIQCVAPAEITDDALLEYARGNAPAFVTAHIDHCTHCRHHAHEYAVLERGLRARLYRRTCPDTLTLGEYALGTLPSQQLLPIADHLVECPHCAAECRGFTQFLSERDEPPAERGVFAAIRRLVARPLIAPDPVFAGLRGGSGDGVSYAAEDVQIFVSVQRDTRGRGFVLAGMLQTGDAEIPAGAEAGLYEGDRLLQSEPVDDLGSFFFNGVSPGAYRVEVRLPDTIVELESVTVA